MQSTIHKAIAIVGVGAVLPDAPDAPSFWSNIESGRYSIQDVPADRWDPELYWDPDPKTPDKSYSKIGGWVQQWVWDPLAWKLPIPPRVGEAMDRTQKWAMAASREALESYRATGGRLDPERTAVIFGNAMAGDKHYLTALRLFFPEYAQELAAAPSFQELPEKIRRAVTEELRQGIGKRLPEVTEDTMPGELANIIAGRIANVFNFHGPNYVVDAACASAMAALGAAVEGLEEHDYDAVITGGVDANMSASTFIKFCKIGALSATGTRPYADGADGFVMGEGAAAFVLKRLEDAERDGDRIHALIIGVGGSSDGKGKGITAPNPVGQRLAVERAWEHAGVSPATVGLLEGHGTSTKVGDVVEVESLNAVFGSLGLPPASVPLGSVKSNIGHLKGAAGAAGMLKTAFALEKKQLPPSLGFERPNPSIDFGRSPFYVNTELKPWEPRNGEPRRAGVSAFGFGGTNFHVVMEEYIPGRRTAAERTRVSSAGVPGGAGGTVAESRVAALQLRASGVKAPPRGATVLAAASEPELVERLRTLQQEAEAGRTPPLAPPSEEDLRAAERLVLDWADAEELAKKAGMALKAFGKPSMWRMLRPRGIHRGSGKTGGVAFLYTGQGSQYVNMLRQLRDTEPVVAETFAEADRVMTPILGRPLSELVFVDPDDAAAAAAEEGLRQTAVTQPAVLAADVALTRLLALYGFTPDMVMGHSLGEYGALVAAGALPFTEALAAVSARGQHMSRVSVDDFGWMAAVSAPLPEIEATLAKIDGYVVVANINSNTQAVIGGATEAVRAAMDAFEKAGRQAKRLPVSHAFHTSIVAPASEPLRRELEHMSLEAPHIPLISNVTGEFYPSGPGAVPQMIDLLAQQIAAPVQFVKGLHTLYDHGVRVFVEVGPKRALYGFAEEVMGEAEGVLALYTNHPRLGDLPAFNQALCGLWAAGLGVGTTRREEPVAEIGTTPEPRRHAPPAPAPGVPRALADSSGKGSGETYTELGHLFADFLEKGFEIYSGRRSGGAPRSTEPVVISGAGLGLPGGEKVFSDENVARILAGEQRIDAVPMELRRGMVEKNITRLVKGESGGGPRFETIESPAEVIKLAGRGGGLDLVEEFGFSAERLAALDRVTQLAVAAGIDALRDAGIPLVQRYKKTTTGSRLPDGWLLPEEMGDETGVLFAAAFPGIDSLVDQLDRYHLDQARRRRLEELESLRSRLEDSGGNGNGRNTALARDLDGRIRDLTAEIQAEPFVFDRRFLFRVLAMGHSQFAELIGARGPNMQINSACATTTQAVSVATDWIRSGRCRRVVIISADDVTNERLMDWFGAGFLATGAAATDERVEEAAIPFDRRRHGLILGMGAAALVVESEAALRQRGLAPICEVLASETANSAYHGTRLDVEHICGVMERLVAKAEARYGIDRHEMAGRMVFISHETYTPARGGSAQAEVHALRRVFGASADRIVIANTKGFTGHPMAAGIEDVVAVKTLETGIVPPVANFKEIDPELGRLNLSRGGAYPVEFALRLGAGFGSQISMSLLRHRPAPDGRRRAPEELGYAYRVEDAAAWQGWLARVSGDPSPDLEVVRRTLRVRDHGAARRAPAPPAAPATTEPPRVEPAAPAVPAVAATPSGDPVRERVLAIIAEQTGYPTDMLDPELDLEADLGIDTVKQAEMFAAIRAEWNIPRDENLQLRDFPTLAHAVRFVYDRRPDLKAPTPAAAPPPAAARETPAAAAPAATPAVAAADPVPAPSPAMPSAAPSSAPGADAVQEKVLAIIAEQTGYPPEMLDLDLDLEADLGIDTVKQAEMFAAIRAEWDIPRDENLELRNFPTLAHAVRFVYERRPDLEAQPAAVGKDVRETAAAQAPAPPAEAPPVAPSPVPVRAVHVDEEALRSIPRRVPVAVLRPPLELCKPTGVHLEKKCRVLVMPDQGGVGKALTVRLDKLGVEVLTIDGAPAAEELRERIARWREEDPIHGVYWLPALDAEGELADLTPVRWHEALRLRVKLLFATLQAVGDDLGKPGTFLVSATRLGGRHGYDAEGATAPLGGAVTGLTKAFARERQAMLVKAVDFGPSRKTAALAELLLAETSADPGCIEIGYHDEHRWTVTLDEQPVEDGRPGIELGPGTVFVITGAAGSIVSAIVSDLAHASGGIFHLLDRIPEPDPADPDIALFRSDREALKRELFERLKARGERATPAKVEQELAALERSEAALAALEAVRGAGGFARYHQADLLDEAAVAEAMESVRRAHGRVDVLLHAAGLEISRLLADKTPEEFDRVFDVKADGWFHLLHALGDAPLGAAVAFSSIAGRFGNAGQTDYSAANDLLCKVISSLRNSHPASRGIAIDWTAWGGIGMATRGSIPKMMEAAGIDMLPPAAGIPVVRRELAAGGFRGEVLVAGSLGAMAEERDGTAGLDLTAGSLLARRLRGSGVMLGRVTGMGVGCGLTVEKLIDPCKQPFLDDHRIDGTPVLPGVMGIESFAEAALVLFPDRHVSAVEDVDFLAPFKFYRDEPRTVRVVVTFTTDGDDIVARCRLEGERELPGRDEPQRTVHFRGRVRLSTAPPEVGIQPVPTFDETEVDAEDIYRVYFHGPAYQVLGGAWRWGDAVAGRLAEKLPAHHRPEKLPTRMAPRLVELCFQTAGIWDLGTSGRLGLPHHLDRVTLLRHPESAVRLMAVASPVGDSSCLFDAYVVDEHGNVYVILSGYRTIELPGVVQPELLAPLEEALRAPAAMTRG